MGFFGVPIIANLALLAIPIGVTLGVLFGVDAQRAATGQSPIYSPPAGGTDDVPHDNKVVTKTYCQKSFGTTPYTTGQKFTFNPNQWGWDPAEGGGLCMNVTTFNNGTYASDTTSPQWTITWQYPQGPPTSPVHSFPNVQLDGGVFPATIKSLSEIGIDMQWTYGLGNDTAATTDQASLDAESLNANVAIDMFFDSNKASSGNSSEAAYEVMVWFADFGAAAQPIGLAAGAVTTETVNGTTFNLYYGQNSLGQNVLTWVASKTTDSFTGDLLPLVTKLFTLDNNEYPTETDYLGYLAFGSEAYYSQQFVTFTAEHFSIDVKTA